MNELATNKTNKTNKRMNHEEYRDNSLSLRGFLQSVLSKQSRLELTGNCNSNILFEECTIKDDCDTIIT